MSQTVAFNSFGKGELSPAVRGRVDTEHYYSSAESLNNMIVRPYGNPVRRAGTKFMGEVKDATEDVRLIEFVFSTETSYVLEMGVDYFRFWKDNELITINIAGIDDWVNATEYIEGDIVRKSVLVPSGYLVYVCTADHTSDATDNEPGSGTDWEDFWGFQSSYEVSGIQPLEVFNNYTEEELWDVDYAQKDDSIKFTHQLHQVSELRRYSETGWCFFNKGIVQGAPWGAKNGDWKHRVQPDVATPALPNTGILLSNREMFSIDDVGRFISIGDFYTDAAFASGGQGFVEITDFNNSKSVDILVKATISTGVAQTSNWAWNAFEEDNYPANITYHESRLVLANTPNEPQQAWFSKSFRYNAFNTGDSADFGFDLTLNTEQANQISWLSSGENLSVGTFGSEFLCSSPNDGSLNSENKNARRQSAWGSPFIRPKSMGNRAYFVQRGLRKLRELFYVWDNNNYDASDMTKYSEHITLSGIKDMDYQRNQDSLLWTVLNNGNIAILSRQPDDEIMAWTPWETTNGDVKSIRFTPNPDGLTDRGTMIVERIIDGNTVKYLESFDNHVIEDDTLQEDLYYVDCGVQYASSATVFDGLDHLEAEVVAIFVDGLYEGTATVSGGQVANPAGLGVKACVGLPYTSTVQINPLTVPNTQTGVSKGQIERIHNISLDVYKSLGIEYSSDGTNWFPTGLPEAIATDELYTGMIPNITFEGILNYTGYIYLRQTKPYPFNLQGLYAQVKFSGIK